MVHFSHIEATGYRALDASDVVEFNYGRRQGATRYDRSRGRHRRLTYSENGRLYLLWKADGNCCALPATIYIQPLSADGRTLTGPATPLIHNDQPFEGAVVEAPTLIKHNGSVERSVLRPVGPRP